MSRQPDKVEDTANKILKDVRVFIKRAISFYTDVPKRGIVRMTHLMELSIVLSWLFLSLGIIIYIISRG